MINKVLTITGYDFTQKKATKKATKKVESYEEKYFRFLRAMNDMVKGSQFEYRNGIIATALANGHGEKLTEDWLRKVLLGDVEDQFITYEEALAVAPKYMEAINTLK